MDKPNIAQKKPYVMKLEAGTHFWCACGNSDNQPFCDGSHKGTEIKPTKIVIEEDKTQALCGCKHSKNGAFCDGTHKDL